GALLKTVDTVREFTDGLHNANMEFAKYSGSMAAVQAESDMRDFYRKQKQGDQLAPSAQKLSESRARLEDAAAPVDTAWKRLQNNIGAMGADFLTGLITD